MTALRISVVIPTRNAGGLLDQLLEAIRRQEGDFAIELIGVDSGSTDGTPERLRAAGATTVTLPAATFDHGLSRNAGLARATGDLGVLLVQDAVPASCSWLAGLVQPLLADGRVAGSFARQQPWPSASRVAAHYLAGWVAGQPAPRWSGPLDARAYAAMTPAERHDACAFDNVCSCIRLSVWREHPFRSTRIAEDLEWARDVLLAGHRLAYAPAAVVWHSHDRTARYELSRTYLLHQRLQRLFGLTTVPTAGALARSIVTTLPLHARLAAAEPRSRVRALARGAALAVAWPLGQYLGARSAREGRELLRVRGV